MRRLTCLDGLRGVLAMYVMASHVLPFAVLSPSQGWLVRLMSHGGAAVDIFFILSGLVILQSLHAYQGRPRGFLLARVTRIFPVYLLAFAAALALRPLDYGLAAMPWIGPDSPVRMLVASGWPETTGLEIAAHLVMAHGVFPDAVLPYAWVRFLGAAWSLSTEWQFYVLALGLACWRVRDSRLMAIFLALAVAGLVWQMRAPEGWGFSRAFLPNKAQYFALGIASAAVLARRAGAARQYLAVLAAVLAISFAQVVGQVGAGWMSGAGKLVAPLAWTACLLAQMGSLPAPLAGRPARVTAALAPLAALLRHPALIWLGAVSYPLYIAHEPVHKLLCIVLGRLAGGNAALFTAFWLPLAILLPILLAWWLHRAVELPAQHWGRARSRAATAHAGA